MNKVLAWISVSVGGLASFLALALASQFFFVPHGAHIRPMGWTLQITCLAGFALVVGVPTALYALFKPPRKLALIGLVLSLLPYPLSIVLVRIASAVCGFTLSP